VDQVLLDGKTPVPTEVSSNTPGRCLRGVGLANHRPEPFDNAVTGDTYRDDRAGFHELNEWLKKRLALVFGIVCGQELAVGVHHPDIEQLIALGFNPTKDFSRQIPRHTVWFHQYEGLFDIAH